MLAKRYFHADEQAVLEACEGDGARAFLEIWTAKEAMLKLLGKGLADGLEKTRVMNDRAGEFGATPVNLYRLEWEDCLGTLASLSEIRLVRERTY
jgi:4'-phosphopantetheinyl transferase